MSAMRETPSRPQRYKRSNRKMEIVMTVVTVEMRERYTDDQKRQLAKDITDAFVKLGLAPEVVNII